MKERGILFNGEMVRALLDGRKTKTRRVVKGRVYYSGDDPKPYYIEPGQAGGYGPSYFGPEWCPHGKTGDRLWVREKFVYVSYGSQTGDWDGWKDYVRIGYAADNESQDIHGHSEWTNHNLDKFLQDDNEKWRPSIHMPRWASRIDLEITDVRVERVQDITEADAKAEGLTGRSDEPKDEGGRVFCWKGRSSAPCPRAHFSQLWDSINEKRGFGWSKNPWVWVVEFKRVECK